MRNAAASAAPLFYEALVWFAQKPIPFGEGYESWQRKVDSLMQDGKEIYFVGPGEAGKAKREI